MDEENQPNQSEWNEQQAFSRLFFKLTESARIFQINGAITKWAETIISKISMVLGIADDTEKAKLKKYKDGLFFLRNQYIKSRNSTNKGKLYNLCFEVESDVDTIANKHMPFLKIRREDDIQGL